MEGERSEEGQTLTIWIILRVDLGRVPWRRLIFFVLLVCFRHSSVIELVYSSQIASKICLRAVCCSEP